MLCDLSCVFIGRHINVFFCYFFVILILFAAINDGQTAAFNAYMSTDQSAPGRKQTLIFDRVPVNLGNGYNKHDGIFTAPATGYYVFSWTIACDVHGRIYTELIQNSNSVGAIVTNSEEINDVHQTTGLVVANINQGDVIHIRTSITGSTIGAIKSDSTRRSSFSGWKIY